MVYIGYSMLLLEVLQLLCENKIDFVLKRYGQKLTDKVLDELGWDESDRDHAVGLVKDVILRDLIEDIDPSEKYLEWIVKQYIAGLFNIGEDESQIKEDLEEFEKNKRNMQYQDINRYNLRTLRQELKKFDTSGNEGDFGADIQKAIENNDIKLVERCEGFVIYHALTKEGNILLGKGGGHKFNKWCTARTDDQNKFEYYNTELNSDIYVAIFENGKRFQFDIDRVEHLVQNCMDELDDDMLGGDESPDSHYWPIIRESKLLQKNYQESMERHWAFNSTMTTWEQFVEDSIKHNKRIVPSLSSVLQGNGFKDYAPWYVSPLLRTTADAILQLSDINFLEDLETLGVLYDRKYNDSFNRHVTDLVLDNSKIYHRVYNIFSKSDRRYELNEFGSFVGKLYVKGEEYYK